MSCLLLSGLYGFSPDVLSLLQMFPLLLLAPVLKSDVVGVLLNEPSVQIITKGYLKPDNFQLHWSIFENTE